MKKCLECGKELNGRIDKKFCDNSCRTAYNNKKRYILNQKIKNINNILRKNFILLDEAYKENKRKINIASLINKGFLENYYTSSSKKHNRLICYTYSYYINNKGIIFIDKLRNY